MKPPYSSYKATIKNVIIQWNKKKLAYEKNAKIYIPVQEYEKSY